MKETKAILMTAIVVFVVIAMVSSVSAYLVTNGQVAYDSGETTWTYEVTCAGDDPHDISNWIVAWCSKSAVLEVKVNGIALGEGGDPGWDYGEFYGVQGIKIDYQVDKGNTVNVEIILSGQYGTAGDAVYGIKAGNLPIVNGVVYGPVACNPIPEFSTIAMPVAMILGLLFFFNHRKKRGE